MRRKTQDASVSSRCCICGWRFDHKVKPCVVCERVICTGCSTQHDLLAAHLDKDAAHFLAQARRTQGVEWSNLELMIERRMRLVLALKAPKSHVRRIVVMGRKAAAVGGGATFATYFDLVIAARVLAMDARHDLPAQSLAVPLMRDVDGMIVQFTPAADLSDTLPPMLRRRLHQPTEEETPDDDDNDGPRARCDE